MSTYEFKMVSPYGQAGRDTFIELKFNDCDELGDIIKRFYLFLASCTYAENSILDLMEEFVNEQRNNNARVNHVENT